MALVLDGDTGIVGVLLTDANGNVTFDTNTLYVDAPNNRVGIGTTVPDGKLTVALENSNTPAFRLSSPTSGTDFAISSYNDANGTYVSMGVNHLFNVSGNDAVMDTNDKSAAIVLDGRNNGRIQFLTNSSGIATPRMTILQDGNVGIGSTSPESQLTISRSNSALYSTLRFTNSGTSGRQYEIGIGGSTSAAGFANNLYFYDSTASSNRMVIASSGNIGIGTGDPQRPLHVLGANAFIRIESTSTSQNSQLDIKSTAATWSIGQNQVLANTGTLEFYNGSSSPVVIKTNGNVGIGTTNPEVTLDVTNSRSTEYSNTQDQRGLAHIVARNGSDAAGRFSSISWVSGGGTQAEGSVNLVQTGNYVGDFTVKLRTGANSTDWRERVRIKANGNVGIGTSSPTSQLHVHGDTSNTFSALMLRNRGQVSGSAVKAIWSLNRDGSDVDFEAGSITVGKQQNWTTTPSTVDSYMAFSLTGNESIFETMRLNPDGFAQLNSASQVRFTLGNEGTPGSNTANWIRGSGGQLGLNAAHDNIHFEIGGSQKMILNSSGLQLPGNYQYNAVDGFGFYYPTGRMQLGFNYNSFGAEIILGNNRTASGETAFMQYRTNGVNEGTLVGNGSGFSITNVSDYRKKENITELANGSLEKVINVRPVTYTLKEEYTNDTSKIYTGFIAHEFQEQFPNSVRGVKDELNEDGTPKLQSIDIASNELLTHLIKSIQELKTENDALKARLDSAGL